MKSPKQLEFKKIQGWGGKRKGAGRPNQSGTVNHMARPRISGKLPIHITQRLKPNLKNLRSPMILTEIKRSLAKAKGKDLRVIHFSLQSNHIHIVAEAKNNRTLACALKSFGCSFGKAIRKYCGGTGSVFEGRYHIHILKTPAEARNAIAYVLLNQSKHRDFIPYTDVYSSAGFFYEWRKLLGRNIGPILKSRRPRRKPLPNYLSPPRTWLARDGWRQANP